ncbi:hypothetical protein ACFSQQ_10360 [Mesorhizobium kowhaii]|uniref:hypothetical protein n=1 Tax=Mesorhizobium kowhaii TaxID=1300272 RepID=UPI0035E48AB3
MARTKFHKRLSEAEIERFLAEAERLHKSIVQPLLSPTSEHYRALQRTHEALLKTVKDITGKMRRSSSGSGRVRCGLLRLGSAAQLSHTPGAAAPTS